MKKLLSSVCILTAIAYQPAQARGYVYDSAGYDAPEYVEVDGARYVRIPQVKSTPRYRLSREDEWDFEERRVIISQPREYNVRPYIGLDLSKSKVKFGNLGLHEKLNLKEDLEDSYLSFTAVAGMRLNKYFGIELFFQQSEEKKKATHDYGDFWVGFETKFNAYGIDFIGYAPFSQNAELLAALGFGNYNFDVNMANTTMAGIEQFSTTGIRFGAGFQYYLNDNLALRVMGRYVRMTDDYILKNMIEASVGLRYMF